MAKRRLSSTRYRSNPNFRQLCRAFLSCKNENEVADLFRDVATLSELQAFSERLQIAQLVDRGVTYRDIMEITKASTTTVTRVANFLRDGTGGYRRVLDRLHTHTRSRKEKSVDV